MPNYRPPPIRVTYKAKNSQLSSGLSIASATLFDPEPNDNYNKARNKASSYERYITKETEIVQDITVGDSKPFFISLLDMSAFVSNPSKGQSSQKQSFSRGNSKKTDRFFHPLKEKNSFRHSSLISQSSNIRNETRGQSEDVKHFQKISYKYPAFTYRNSKPNHLKYYKYLQKKQRSYHEKPTPLTTILTETPSLEGNQIQINKVTDDRSQETHKLNEVSKTELNLGQHLETDSLATLRNSNLTHAKQFYKQNQHYKPFVRTKVFEKRQLDKLKEVKIHDIELNSFQISTNDGNTDAATQTFSTKQALNSFKIKKNFTIKREKPAESKFYNYHKYISTSPRFKSSKTDYEVSINNSII